MTEMKIKKILVLGAGRSSSSLIRYLLSKSKQNQWQVTVADLDQKLAAGKTGDHPQGTAISFNVLDTTQLDLLISNTDIVMSMLPASMHYRVAVACLEHRKPMVTASYVSAELKKLDEEAAKKGVLILNEMGVDPGIDHMSAMRIIDRIRSDNGKLDIFESSTGGLVAPGSDNNPWRYKFTWNPRNVILAGQKGARFLHNGKFKYIPYHKIFQRYEIISVLDLGYFEVYPNRDSLKYKDDYGLDEISTMFRGTIRIPGYCDAWNLLVQLGATDDSYVVEFPGNKMTYRDFINSFLAYNILDPVETKISRYLDIPEKGELMEKLRWLGLFEKKAVGLKNATPARILQFLLEEKWKLSPEDRDMIVMQHQFEYLHDEKRRRIVSSMYLTGENSTDTAMAKSVGLPVAIAAELILDGTINQTGVKLPVSREIYEPVLNRLEDYGIRFIEEEHEMDPV